MTDDRQADQPAKWFRVTAVPGDGPPIGETLESMGLKVGQWITIPLADLFPEDPRWKKS